MLVAMAPVSPVAPVVIELVVVGVVVVAVVKNCPLLFSNGLRVSVCRVKRVSETKLGDTFPQTTTTVRNYITTINHFENLPSSNFLHPIEFQIPKIDFVCVCNVHTENGQHGLHTDTQHTERERRTEEREVKDEENMKINRRKRKIIQRN